jgi:hypothetical protein
MCMCYVSSNFRLSNFQIFKLEYNVKESRFFNEY